MAKIVLKDIEDKIYIEREYDVNETIRDIKRHIIIHLNQIHDKPFISKKNVELNSCAIECKDAANVAYDDLETNCIQVSGITDGNMKDTAKVTVADSKIDDKYDATDNVCPMINCTENTGIVKPDLLTAPLDTVNKQIMSILNADNSRDIFVQPNITEKYMSDNFLHTVNVIYNGKIMRESVPIRSLSNNKDIVFRFAVKNRDTTRKSDTKCEKSNDIYSQAVTEATKNAKTDLNFVDTIKMNPIEKPVNVRVAQTGKKITVDPKNLATYDGKLYLITKRQSRLSFREELRALLFGFRIDIAIKLLAIFLLFLTKNREFALLLVFILGLRILGLVPARFSVKGNTWASTTIRTVGAFFISMFLISNDKILVYD